MESVTRKNISVEHIFHKSPMKINGKYTPTIKVTKQDIEGTESNSVTEAELRHFESNCNNYWERIGNEIKKRN